MGLGSHLISQNIPIHNKAIDNTFKCFFFHLFHSSIINKHLHLCFRLKTNSNIYYFLKVVATTYSIL